MSGPEFDAVIAGGGLSGLSLAAHLVAAGWSGRSVLVVDDGSRAPAATSWAFWSSAEGLLDSAVSRTFRQVRVYAGGVSRVTPLDPYRYQVVHRDDLRRVVHRIASGHHPVVPTVDAPRVSTVDGPVISFVDGHVDAVLDPPGEAAEVVVDGRAIRASWVFDSVTRTPPSTVDGWLAFTGDEVHTDEPRFDPTTPTLMDFRTPQGTGVRFAYVLPTDEHRALVELTEFVPRHATPPPEVERRDALGTYLREVVGGRHEVLRTESAVLPLSAYPGPRRHARVLDIGVHGGLVKASTGYAYQRIQRDSAAIARSLVAHGHPFDVPAPRPRHRLLDALLLDVLDHDPAQLELAFARLFGRHPAERVLRFLDEDTAPRDELRLIATLPPVPYLRALARRPAKGHPGRQAAALSSRSAASV